MVQEEILIIWFLESEIGLAANLADHTCIIIHKGFPSLWIYIFNIIHKGFIWMYHCLLADNKGVKVSFFWLMTLLNKNFSLQYNTKKYNQHYSKSTFLVQVPVAISLNVMFTLAFNIETKSLYYKQYKVRWKSYQGNQHSITSTDRTSYKEKWSVKAAKTFRNKKSTKAFNI